MHPINSKSFGPEGIQIKFVFDGDVLTGHIVKQTGASRYVVAHDADAEVTSVVSLTSDPDLAQQISADELEDAAAAEGLATIVVTTADATTYAARILSRTLITTDGDVFSWGFADATDNLVKLDNTAPVDSGE